MIYLQIGQQRIGPLDEDELRLAYARGDYPAETMSWKQGERAWTMLAKRWGRRHAPGRGAGLALAASLVLLLVFGVLMPWVTGNSFPRLSAPGHALLIGACVFVAVGLLWRYARKADARRVHRAWLAGFALAALTLPSAAMLAIHFRVDLIRGQGPDAVMMLSDDHRVLRIEGNISDRFVDDFEAMLASAPELQRIDISSPGGLVDDALLVAGLIRDRRLTVRGVVECASACVLIWASAPVRELEDSAAIGLHRMWLDEKLPEQWRDAAADEFEAESLEILKNAGFSESLIEKWTTTPSEGMAWVESAELLTEGVELQVVDANEIPLSREQVLAAEAKRDPNQKKIAR